MSELEDERLRCGNCRSEVDLGTGLKLTMEWDGEKISGALCGDCADIECRHCGGLTSIRSLLEGDLELLSKSPLVECDRCEEEVPAREAVEIRHPNDPHYQKRICEDCFKEITIPPDYNVIRDFQVE